MLLFVELFEQCDRRFKRIFPKNAGKGIEKVSNFFDIAIQEHCQYLGKLRTGWRRFKYAFVKFGESLFQECDKVGQV